MDLAEAALLLSAALAAGVVNAIAGGGSLILFPALLATGLSPVAANVTNSVAVFPGYAASVFGTRMDLAALAREPRRRRTLLSLIPTAVAGSAAGCALLLGTSERTFTVVVPFLVLAATVILAAQVRLRAVITRRREITPRAQRVLLHLLVAVGSVYGGYFGAALGVLMVAALGLVLTEPLARISALKNAISTLVGLVTVVAFAVFGPVDWADVALLVPASIAGGYLGSQLARRLPAAVLRAVIVTFGLVLSAALFWQAFS